MENKYVFLYIVLLKRKFDDNIWKEVKYSSNWIIISIQIYMITINETSQTTKIHITVHNSFANIYN